MNPSHVLILCFRRYVNTRLFSLSGFCLPSVPILKYLDWSLAWVHFSFLSWNYIWLFTFSWFHHTGNVWWKFAQHVPSTKILITQFMHPARNSPLSLSSKRSLRPATSWGVHYTTSCNTQSRAPEDGKIIARNMLSWLELLISRYCCI